MNHSDEVEVILVDDGCDEIRFDIFTEFNIIHLSQHGGASHAWNVGLDYACGDYIAFIDSDDMIMMNYIDEILHAIDTYHEDEIVFNFVDTARNVVVCRPTCRAIWKAVYRSNIVPRFDNDCEYKTDIPFQRRLQQVPHTKTYLNKILYCYNSMREGSISWNHREEPCNFVRCNE
jgi:glycosyltransferase involved in cell wall biosynthesis